MLIKIRTVKIFCWLRAFIRKVLKLMSNSLSSRLVDLDTGTFSLESDISSFDQRKSAKDPSQSMALTSDQIKLKSHDVRIKP